MIKVVCGKCGSDLVLRDAFASWDITSQTWELYDVYDKGSWCEACEEMTTLKEIPIDNVV